MPKPSSHGTLGSSHGPKQPSMAASNSTAPRRSSERSQPGTPAACSHTSSRSPVPPRAQHADEKREDARSIVGRSGSRMYRPTNLGPNVAPLLDHFASGPKMMKVGS